MTPVAACQEYERRVAKRLRHRKYRFLDQAEVCLKVESKIANKVARGEVQASATESGWGFIERVLSYAVIELHRSEMRRMRRQAHHLHRCPKPAATPLQYAAWREELGTRYADPVVFRS